MTRKEPGGDRPRGGNKKSNLRGRPQDTPDTRISKTLSYILRHGAEKEGLTMRSDGYVKVNDLLARPKLRDVDFPTLDRLVKENDKQRYQLLFEPLGPPPQGDSSAETTADGIWWIRANQGHTVKVEELELLEVKTAEDLPVAVHGTSQQAWSAIAKEGLSRMKRNHIHLATGKLGDAGVISGMRATHAKSGVLIWIDVPLALESGIKFFISANGVVLTPGDEEGRLEPNLFNRVEDHKGNVLFENKHDKP